MADLLLPPERKAALVELYGKRLVHAVVDILAAVREQERAAPYVTVHGARLTRESDELARERSVKALADENLSGAVDCEGEACGVCRECLRVLLAEATKGRDRERARAEAAERDLLAIARAAGIVYEADGHSDQPGPTAAIVAEVEELRRGT